MSEEHDPADRRSSTVGVIGLGDIGAGLARSLLRSSVPLGVCDIREEALAPFADDALVAANPRELGEACDTVFIAVVDDATVRKVMAGPDGLRAGARPGTVVIVVSTVSIPALEEVARDAAADGIVVIDCGVSGGPRAAADGLLVCMVGGDDEAIEKAGPALEAIGSEVLRMGPLGAGLTAKLARNLVQYGSWCAAYEASRIAEAAGIPLAKLASAIRDSDKLIGGAATLMFRPTTASLSTDRPEDVGLIAPMTAAAGLARKDLDAFLELATSLGLAAPLAELTIATCAAIFGLGEAG